MKFRHMLLPAVLAGCASGTIPSTRDDAQPVASHLVRRSGLYLADSVVRESRAGLGGEAATAKIGTGEKTTGKPWEVRRSDRTLRATLSRWAADAGFQLAWDVNQDIEVSLDAQFHGSFEEALTSLMESLQESALPVSAVLYENRVLRVVKSNSAERSAN